MCYIGALNRKLMPCLLIPTVYVGDIDGVCIFIRPPVLQNLFCAVYFPIKYDEHLSLINLDFVKSGRSNYNREHNHRCVVFHPKMYSCFYWQRQRAALFILAGKTNEELNFDNIYILIHLLVEFFDFEFYGEF